MGKRSKEVSVVLMVVVVTRKRIFWLLSGTRGAEVEHTTQESEKQGWTQTDGEEVKSF